MCKRCGWVGPEQIYIDYHDTEWGVPERDPRALWEKLVLDGFQAGLSWLTILKKRENFRAAFDGFEPQTIASWGTAEVERLLQDRGIVRHRGKIEATISNAQAYLTVHASIGFETYLWDFVDGTPIQGDRKTLADVPAFTPVSEALSKDLKRRGFRFCGPTITYAAMQAMGLVNDHLVTCPRYEACRALA